MVSCARCQLHRGKVPTEAAFSDLQHQLGARVEAGELTREDGPAVRLARDPRPLPTEYYQCRHCDAVWRLTAPRRHDPTQHTSFETMHPGALIEMMRAGSASGVPVVREPVSMYADSMTVSSPDGRFTATMTGATEFHMGSPTRGTLKLSNGIVCEHCGPSVVWSDDSEYLAASEIVDASQPARVLVFSMTRRDARYAPGDYHGLEFQSFSGGSVRATDGDKAIEIDVSGLEWDAPSPEPSDPERASASVQAPPVSPHVPEPREIVEPIAVAAPVARENPPSAAAMPRGWAVVNDELRLPASPPSSFDGVLTAVAVVSVTLLFWVFIFITNQAGLTSQSPVLLGAPAIVSLLAVGWLTLRRGRWRVVFDRATGSVRATRRGRSAGPMRFTPGIVSLRTARTRAFVTLRLGTVDLVLASRPAAEAAALREAIVAWMMGNI